MNASRKSYLHLPDRTFAGVVLLSMAVSRQLCAQTPPEPPLPVTSSREARAAAAAIQTPSNVRPPPPIPSQLAAPAGPESTMPAPPPASPIPPQAPGATAEPAQRGVPSAPAAAPSSLPTGFTSRVTSSTSASGQFKVYGKDLQTRSPFSARCDEVADALRRLLRDNDPWVLPVVVSIKSPPEVKFSGPAVSTTISQITNGGFHLQVTVQLRPDLRPAAIDAELTRILIAERILRNKTAITTSRSMVLPEWLLTGITQAMTFRDRARPSAVFAAIFKSGKIYGIEEILDVAPGQLDALSRTIYETSCCALVMALLDQIEGPAGMKQFLSLLAVDSRDDRDLLNQCFPGLALSSSSLNKWWSLQMASLATPSVFETLGPTATRKALAEALMIHYESTAESAPKRSVVADTDAADAPPGEPPPEEKKQGLLGRIFGKDGGGEGDGGVKTREAAGTGAKPARDMPPEEAVQEEEKKRGMFGRLFGGSPSAPDEPGAAEAAEEKKLKPEAGSGPPPEPEKASKEKKKPDAPPTDEPAPDEPRKPGLFGRMFGSSAAKEDTEAAPGDEKKKAEPAPKAERKKEDKPKPEAEPATKTENKPASRKKAAPDEPESPDAPAEPKKRGLFGRMFGSGSEAGGGQDPGSGSDKKAPPKKSDEETRKDEKKDESAALMGGPSDPVLVLQNHWMTMASHWIDLADRLWHQYTGVDSARQVKLRLGFSRKKTDEEEKPAEEQDGKKTKTEKSGEEKPAGKSEKEKTEKADDNPVKKASPAPAAKPKSNSPKPRMVRVSIPLDDYANIMKRKDRAIILNGTSRALAALTPRAHVLFRPIIDDYIALVTDLQEGKTKDADQRLEALRTRTAKASDQAKAVEEQLDLYEANETKNYSGAFEDYLKLPAQIEKELPVRDDAISRYLDALDLEFGR